MRAADAIDRDRVSVPHATTTDTTRIESAAAAGIGAQRITSRAHRHRRRRRRRIGAAMVSAAAASTIIATSTSIGRAVRNGIRATGIVIGNTGRGYCVPGVAFSRENEARNNLQTRSTEKKKRTNERTNTPQNTLGHTHFTSTIITQHNTCEIPLNLRCFFSNWLITFSTNTHDQHNNARV